MKDPAVLFYTQDFLTGTAFFTDEQRGQYIRLLCEQHQLGHIPENHMLTICLTLANPVVKKFVQDADGNYYNVRMEEEVAKRRNFIQSRIDNGLKGGRHKKPYANPYAKPNGKAKNNLSDNINENVIKELYKGVEIFFDEDCRPKTEKAKNEWYDTLDKLIRIDGYSPEHIHDVIKRARMDDFWRQNFLSILKLRKKNKDGIPYFTVFEKKLNNGTKKTIGADPYELAILEANKLGIQH
jgi:uncharacterized protein YdaU (DUF1376 family)